MSQKETLSKLKNFFRMDKAASGNNRDKNDTEILRELSELLAPHNANDKRCKTLKELCEPNKIHRLKDETILELYNLTKDLIMPTKPIEYRHITYRFYQKLVENQFQELSLIRETFFRNIIDAHDVPEDIQCQLNLLKTMTDNGKDIKPVDDVIGKFILNRWLSKISDTEQIKEILTIVHNIIVYNAAYLDPNFVDEIITYACYWCCTPEDVVSQCLDILEAVLCYSVLPQKMLQQWIAALCRTVNKEVYVQKSWDIMKKLLGTHRGHAALLLMCNILHNSCSQDDALLRGAVFYINMGLWGSTSSNVSLFKSSPTSILQSFLTALKSQRLIVTFEVIIGIQHLLNASGRDLTEPSWDVLCEILYTIADNITFYEQTNELPKDNRVLQNAFHETLDKIELLVRQNEAATDPQTIYAVIEYVCDQRPEQSVIQLMEFKMAKISPTQRQWLQELNAFMQRFFHMRSYNICNKSLQMLQTVMDVNRSSYEEEILESIVIPIFANITQEPDSTIRSDVAKLLLNFVVQCDTKRSIELLDIVEKLLNRPFERHADDCRHVVKNDDEFVDLTNVVDELIRVFSLKLYVLPTSHAIKIFTMLHNHLEKCYQKPIYTEASAAVRKRIFAWILKLRANSTYHLGYLDDTKGRTQFSHFLCVIDPNESGPYQSNRQSQTLPNITAQSNATDADMQTSNVSFKRSCNLLIECLCNESDWSVMQLILKGLPLILQNKALFRGVDMDYLATKIIGLGKQPTQLSKSRIDLFTPSSQRPQSSDFQGLVINTIAALIPYHPYIGHTNRNRIITQLRSGLLLSLDITPRVCVQTFTVLLHEVLDSMLRHLPEILNDMSRMSTTLRIAVPLLEFLSTLSRLPNRLFASFTETQFKYVFAISLPYTNPHKYDHYTVSLAHHVIAGWFLTCKLSWRKEFVYYIQKGLTTNVKKAFEEIKRIDHTAAINEDSSNRKRSSSLTERGAKHRDKPHLNQVPFKNDKKTDDDAYNFHMELADTCIDFMSRHAFSTCSALPKRSSTTDYLLTNGQTMSWLVGQNIITITTSSCSSTAVKNGLCDRCALVCQPYSTKMLNESNGGTSPEISSTKSSRSDLFKRYTKATLQHNSGQDSGSSEIISSNSSSIVAAGQPETIKYFKNPNEGPFSNSSGSLDALSRRGSNPDTLDHSSNTISTHSSLSQPNIERIKQICICSCSGFAEIVIIRPTGNMSWMMRVQNHITMDTQTSDVLLQDLINLCRPSLGEIYNMQDQLNDDQIWNNNGNQEPTQPKATTAVPDNKPKEPEKQEPEVASTRKDDSIELQDNSSVAVFDTDEQASYEFDKNPSGPINIPKSNHPEKIPSGSFSDLEGEDDDSNVPFDGNDSRLRNPVRRVNSSPEMSSNWRHPYMSQKSNQSTNSANISLPANDEEITIIDSDLQLKKKNYGKVSCEAIPEEIADSTPPKQNLTAKQTHRDEKPVAVVASGAAKNQQHDFASKSISASASMTKDTLAPSHQSGGTVVPRKQHSADDALQQHEYSQARQQQQINEPRHCSSGSAINLGSMSLSNKQKLTIDTPNLSTKPPQSHMPLSPRALVKKNELTASNFNDIPRGRSKTISVVRGEHDNRDNSKWTFKAARSALNPSSIFLQLFFTGPSKATEQPILITKNAKAIDLINFIPPFEVHKIGVLYVGQGQANSEIDILRNRYGSPRYMDFIQNLGPLVPLKNARDLNIFIDMETDGRDGNFTYVWQDDIIQVTFHVATLMPNKDHDPNCTEKKKNIGNDYVLIVYNDSGEEYNLNTVKSQFSYACVIVEPIELNSNRIYVRCKDEVAKFIWHTEPKIISDTSAPGYARQLALHANLASLVAKSLRTPNQRPYASNWLERLRSIKQLRTRVLKETNQPTSANTPSGSANVPAERETEDFTRYT